MTATERAGRRAPVALLTDGAFTDGEATFSAMIVSGGLIRWTGHAQDAPTESVDEIVRLENRLVTPVLVDAHVHTSDTGQALAGVDLSGARSVSQALDLVALAAAQRPGRPVYAYSWDETDWAEQRPFTSAELDRATSGADVYATRIDMHSACASSTLMDRAQAWHAPGSDGTGLIARDAHHLVREAHRGGVTAQDRGHFIDTAMRASLEAGIGVLHEMGAPVLTSEEDLLAVLAAGRRPNTPEVVGYWGQLVTSADEASALAARLGVQGLAGDLNVDGSIGSRTAALREPYADAIGMDGFAYLSPEEVAVHAAACTRAGLQAGFHVIGDAGMDCAIEGLQRAAADVGAGALAGARHRLEHAEMCHPEHLTALADLGVVASVQPAFDAYWGGSEGMYAARLGAERSSRTNPFADLVGAGVQLALGSDSPVTPFAPWEAMRACVLHHQKDQRLDVATALRLHTRGGHAAARDDRAGRLVPGAAASYVVWDQRGGLPSLRDGVAAPVAMRTVLRGTAVLDRL
ncbi:amidohydrolase [Luteipulveratus flavus]|uniref:Amidohydrolase family protein n=1 Tax=Luteipulveratus flavus TaxID=3031728 RepID=A0ABT6CBD6_9MICO|nr:amidohydrolase family protein [Luteipulveratus sp. YIM 133296]MDF8266212.1 amidohydrolase family protein [Luteipulveratus sp. YIM 133296]